MYPASMTAPVLVVDDDAICRLFCQQVLTAAGHEVLLAATGDSATELAGSGIPALIVLDLHLRGVSGFTVRDAILLSWPRQHVLPVFVAMTGDDTRLPGGQNSAAGFDYVLRKPFTAGNLRDVIDGFLRGRDSSDSPAVGLPGSTKVELERALCTEWASGLEEVDLLISELRWKEATDVLHRLRGAAAVAVQPELAEGVRKLMQVIAVDPGGPDMAGAYLDFLWQGTAFIRAVCPENTGFRTVESIAPFR